MREREKREESMQFQEIVFPNSKGERLAARLDLPADEKPVAYAIFAHCFTCTKNFKAVVNINRALAREGIAVLRFDFTGLGESEGEFEETNFSTNVADLVAASRYLEDSYEGPKLLIGHSLGGAAVLRAAEYIPSCVAVATIAAPAELSHLRNALGNSLEVIDREGAAEVNLAGRTFKITKQFVDDLERTRMEQSIRTLKRALLVLHSPTDEIVSVKNAFQIFEKADYPKGFISLDGADHLLSRREDSLYAASILAAWSGKHLGIPRPETTEEVPDNLVIVRTGRIGYQTEININGHHLLADEPILVGGANTGPTPYDYLLAALGACTSITLRMYADRKAWPLDGIVVRLKHEKIHAQDCQECETKTGKLDQIEREIEMRGALNGEQRRRLLAIADMCPVHRTLQSKIIIKSTLKE
jgi:putative redox protein